MRRILISGIFMILILTGCQSNHTHDSASTDTYENTTTLIEEEGLPIETSIEDDKSAAETDQEIEAISYELQQVPDYYLNNSLIAYEIFPIAFADSDDNGTGDLQGITDQLDYLKNELNVDVIWLNPIHPSPSYHRYDVTDYYGIDPGLGTMDDYKTLLDEAHKRGMKVLLDFVINHTSSKHPWFLAAKTNEDSPFRDYYRIDTLDDRYSSKDGWYSFGNGLSYFASFWSEMPELNFQSEAVRGEIKNIASYWLDIGVDGFRIDAAKHVYDIKEYPTGTPIMELNYTWFEEFNEHIKSVNPSAFLVLETWDSASTIGPFLDGADSSFNFDLSESIISAIVSENRKALQGRLSKVYSTYEKTTDLFVDSVFLANHDQNRLLSQVDDQIEKARLAATIEFTLPGISWIYYGEEIGMLGEKPDERIREAMKWTSDQSEIPNSQWMSWTYNNETVSVEEQLEDPSSILSLYHELTTLKKTDSVLGLGSYIDYEIPTSFRLFSFFRSYEGRTYLVIHNLHSESKSLILSESAINTIWSSMGSACQERTITISPYGSIIIAVSNELVTAQEVK